MTPDTTTPDTTAPTATGRRARARKGEGRQLREDILDATEGLLLVTGSSQAVSIRAVADAVGVTPPSIYRHFPDKTALIFAVCDRHFLALDERMARATEGIDDPVEALTAIARAYVDFGIANPEPYRIMFMTRADETPPQYQDERLGELLAFRRPLHWTQVGIDTGRFRPEHTDAARVTMGFWARVHGLTSLLVTKPGFPWPDDGRFVEEYLDTCLRGVLAEG